MHQYTEIYWFYTCKPQSSDSVSRDCGGLHFFSSTNHIGDALMNFGPQRKPRSNRV